MNHDIKNNSSLNIIRIREEEEEGGEKKKALVEEAYWIGEVLLFEWHPNSTEVVMSILLGCKGHILTINDNTNTNTNTNNESVDE